MLRKLNVLHHLLLNIAGNVDMHRAGTAGGGDVECLLDDAGQLGGILDQIGVLGKGRHGAGDVHLLKDVAAQQVAGNLAGNGHHRDGVHVGRGNTGDEVGGAGARGHHTHAHLAGDAGITGCHMARVLLGTHQRIADLGRGTQNIHSRTDRRAGVAKHALYLLTQKGLHQNLCACHFHDPFSLLKTKKPATLVSGHGLSAIRRMCQGLLVYILAAISLLPLA